MPRDPQPRRPAAAATRPLAPLVEMLKAVLARRAAAAQGTAPPAATGPGGAARPGPTAGPGAPPAV
jgi:hypothetical protein